MNTKTVKAGVATLLLVLLTGAMALALTGGINGRNQPKRQRKIGQPFPFRKRNIQKAKGNRHAA